MAQWLGVTRASDPPSAAWSSRAVVILRYESAVEWFASTPRQTKIAHVMYFWSVRDTESLT